VTRARAVLTQKDTKAYTHERELRRSLLNVMMCNMYRGIRGTRRAVSTYCDAYHVVPDVSSVVGPDVAGDDQIRALNKMLPRSVLPCALALACGACERKWPEVARSDGRIFGPGCTTPPWIRQVVCGRTRFASRVVALEELVSVGTSILGTRSARGEWLGRATADSTGLLIASINLDETWVVRGEVSLPFSSSSCTAGHSRGLSLRGEIGRGASPCTWGVAENEHSAELERTSVPPIGAGGAREDSTKAALRGVKKSSLFVRGGALAPMRTDPRCDKVQGLASDVSESLQREGTVERLDRYQLYSWSVLASYYLYARTLGWDHEDMDDPEDALREIEVGRPLDLHLVRGGSVISRWSCLYLDLHLVRVGSVISR